ncbi:MAG: Uma2 family endonuclease [Thermosynechococcaceae cyanobacterium]
MVTLLSPQRPLSPPSQRLLLEGIAWDTYQALRQDLEGQPGKRLTYDDGLLEILMPLPPHESYKRWLGRLVEIVTEEMDVEIRSLGASTWQRQDLAKGVEADECYYIQNEGRIQGKMELDLQVDPPPDLAIEVDITNPSLPRLPIYGVLKVPEVWRFDGEHITILWWIEGEYQAMERSQALPQVTAERIQHFMNEAPNMGETSWAKTVRQWIREQFTP